MADKLPPALKPIQPFLVISKQFKNRDLVVSYYANMYAVQEGIRLSKNDKAAKAYLLGIMDEIESMKGTLKSEEAVTIEVVGQAHIETVALRVFELADKEDRAANFTKSMIKAFVTASHIFTILKQFGELSDEIEEKMKYSKWKAVEIDRCLKNGITPTPGGPGEETFDDETAPAPPVGFTVQPPSFDQPADPSWNYQPPAETRPTPKPRHMAHQNPLPEATPRYDEYGGGFASTSTGWDSRPSGSTGPPPGPEVQLGPQEIGKAQKLCKFAGSALEYDDVAGAIDYLGKAMKLLQTGKED